MKKSILFSTVLASMLLFVASNVMAQASTAKPKSEHKGLFTDEQKTKMKELKMDNYKIVKPLQNRVNELKARQKTLMTSDQPDMKAINANIDEMSKIQTQIAKGNAEHIQKIRAMLTDEQKMAFDSKMSDKKKDGKMRQGGKKKGSLKRGGKKPPAQGLGIEAEASTQSEQIAI